MTKPLVRQQFVQIQDPERDKQKKTQLFFLSKPWSLISRCGLLPELRSWMQHWWERHCLPE